MSEEKKKETTTTQEVVKHDSIYSALSAFQGENIFIPKNKEFGKKEDKMHFMYADLADIENVVRPALYKHGLSHVFEEGEEGKLVCAIYHTSYKCEYVKLSKTSIKEFEGAREVDTIEYFEKQETNVKRSLGIKVSRAGDMKEIGKESTYARRYMLCEVLGLVSDEDKDVQIEQESKERLEDFALERMKGAIKATKEVDKAIVIKNTILSDLEKLEKKETPSLGLKEEQYKQLLALVDARITEIETQ